jgi:hypothetical protein
MEAQSVDDKSETITTEVTTPSGTSFLENADSKESPKTENVQQEDQPEGLRHIVSQFFDAAADGLDAADMLNPFMPTVLPEQVQKRDKVEESQAPNINNDLALDMSVNIEDKSQDNKAKLQRLPSGEKSAEMPDEGLFRNNPRTDPPIIREPSQMFDFVAEGIDAFDQKFENIEEEKSEIDGDSVNLPKETQQINEKRTTPELTSSQQASSHDVSLPQPQKSDGKRNHSESSDSGEERETQPKGRKRRDWNSLFGHLSSEAHLQMAKLIPRDRRFYQTSNKLNVTCLVERGDVVSRRNRLLLLARDWYDYILTFGTVYIILGLVSFYTIHLLVFAGFYMAISINCTSSSVMTYSQAFAFSLETATTVRIQSSFK